MNGLPWAILLMGPTASGKSAVALDLAASLPLPVEIISVDSAQVFRGMDIGTAKPGAAERAAVPHHLIDFVAPTDAYSAAQFRTDAIALMRGIAERGRVPLLVGGTMLYFKALREGLSALPRADAAVRAAIDAEARERGWPALHAELARVDPATAARLEPADAQRIQRALEVHRVTGRPMSELLGRRDAEPLPYRLLQIALLPSDRPALHRRIEARFEAMLKKGLVEELLSLRKRYALHPGLPSMRCVGYRQAWQFLEGEITEAELHDQGIFATRQLAKRQLTWLRATPAQTFDCLAGTLASQVRRYIETQVEGGVQAPPRASAR
jgi:tRNA dimethylallyltransferase